MYKLSKYILNVNVQDKTYIYSTKTGEYEKLDGSYSEFKNNYNFIEGELKERLVSKEIIVLKDRNEYDELISVNNSLRKNSDFLCLTLMVTRNCNFECSYCFESSSEKYMGNNIDNDICEFIKQYREYNKKFNKLVIFWFGGEPLLHLEYILSLNKKILSICRELDLIYSSRIITNGYLLDRISPYINELSLTDIQVTLDGLKNFHDKRRKHKETGESFDKIWNNIELLKNKNINIIIRCNIDAENIDNVINLIDKIRILNNESKSRFFFQPTLVENYGGKSTCYTENFLTNKEIITKFNKIKTLTQGIKKVCFIKAHCNEKFPGSFIIDTDGKIFKCWASAGIENSKALGNVKDIRLFKNNEYIDKIGKFKAKHVRCTTCNIFPSCMCGCEFQKFDIRYCDKKRLSIIASIHDAIIRDNI